jgi:chromosome segregation protein
MEEQTQEQVSVKEQKGTRISRIVMNGFKSFAKHTEIPFSQSYNCVIGPNGSGKCVLGSTIVSLADGNSIKIGELVNEKIRKNKTKRIDDGYVATGDETKILCLDSKTLKVSKKEIKAYVKRTSPEELLRIKTKSGREITTTTYHPLFILNNEKIETIKAENLNEGVKVAVPRKLDVEIKTKYFYGLIDIITAKDGIYAPYNENFEKILRKLKKSTWKETSKELRIPLNVIKGLLDKQAINFAYLVKILRKYGLDNKSIASYIPKIKSKTASILCNMVWENSPEFSRLLGYLIAEGRLAISSSQIWFTNSSEEIVKDYKNLMERLCGVRVTVNEYKANCYDVLAYSEPLRKLLIKFGMSLGNTIDKKLTNLFLKHSTNEELSNFLNGLYSGDGFIGNSSIEIVTKSKYLADNIESIFLRLGISYRSKYVVKTATNTGFEGIYKQITIYGVENFITFNKNIKLVHEEKARRLESLIIKKSNPNIDLIEVNDLIKNVTDELNINVKKTNKKFPRLDSYCYNQCTPSRHGTNTLIDELFVPLAQESNLVAESLSKLQVIARSDIFWDEIIQVEKIKSKEKWVYDLCVDEHHNFVANNFFVHNSNILDALSFVLGKSSSKSMRAEKAANLIYNGGKSKKPAKHGEVSIFFDNSKKTFPTQDPEVKITRIVRHSGQSVYKINDETRTRQEILDLLSIAKINPDGYNIILQGDIVKFVEMHPDQRRELIGEIAGISIYEEKKHKALLELQKVDERLKETDIVLTERNTYLRELKKDRDQALKYKDMNDKIRTNKASYLKIQIGKKEKEKAEQMQKLDETNLELQITNGKIDNLKKLNEDKRAQIEQISKEIEQKGNIEQVQLNRKVEELKIDLTKKTSRIDTVKNEIERVGKRKTDLQESIKEVQEKIKQLKIDKENMQNDISEKQKERALITKKIHEFKGKHKMDNIGDIEREVAAIDKKSDKLQKEVQVAREQQHNLIREKDSIVHDLATIDAQMKKVLDVEKENKKKLEEAKSKREEFKRSTLDLNKVLEEDSSLAAQLSVSRKNIFTFDEELAKLHAKQAGTREMSYSDIAVKRILDLKKKNYKIHGTVAELGNVKSKYSLALEIAAGQKLKSIVVEDDKTASECIKYLKDNKLGVVSFFPLNKIKTASSKEIISKISKSNGSHGLAIDLISFDKKFKKVFDLIFSDTVVVDNIDVARRLGIGSAKFVTLDGDVADKSGGMRGGFRLKRKHSMGFREEDIEKEIAKQENGLSKLKSTVDVLETRRTENEQLISNLRTKKASLEGEIIKLEKSLHLESSDLEANEEKKTNLEKSEKQIDDKISLVEEKTSSLNSELTTVKTEKQKLRNSIAQLSNPTLVAELNAFEEKLKEIDENVIRIDSEIKNIDTQSQSIYQNELEKTDKILKQLDKDSEEFRKELGEISKIVAEKENELKEKEDLAQEFYAKFKGLFHKRSEIDKEIQKNQSTMNNKQDDSRKVEVRANTFSLKLAELESVLSGLNLDFQQYEGVKLDLSKNEEQLKYEIKKFENMREQIGSVNMRALEIYEEVERQYHELVAKKDNLGKEKEDVLKMMEEIEGKKKDLFMKIFNVVNDTFKRFFSMLTTKGADATLVVENEENPFEAGIRINVKITGSKFLDIRSLSGGEKTMTALAFIFAIQEHEPASFYILDEVDAALDKHNSEKFAKLIRQYSNNAQYVIMSHNDAVISEADNLYGVSMNEHGISQVVSLRV